MKNKFRNIFRNKIMFCFIIMTGIFIAGCKQGGSGDGINQNPITNEPVENIGENEDNKVEPADKPTDETTDEELDQTIDSEEEGYGNIEDIVVDGEYSIDKNLNTILTDNHLTHLFWLDNVDNRHYFYGLGDKEVILSTDTSFDQVKIVLTSPIQSIEAYNRENYDILESTRFHDYEVVRLLNSQGYTVFDLTGKILEEVIYPEAILDKFKKDGFRYYDLSDDGKSIAFTHAGGLDEYDIEKNVFTHLVDNRLHPTDDMYDEVNGVPKFILGDRYISTREFGYEWVAGYNLYNRETKNLTFLKGAFDLAVDEKNEKGLYVYYDKTVMGTYYDYGKDERIRKGVVKNLVDSSYDQGFNFLLNDYAITGTRLDGQVKIYTSSLINPSNFDVSLLVTLHEREPIVESALPQRIFADEQYIYLLIPYAKTNQRVIKVAYKDKSPDLNSYYGPDMVNFADQQVEIMGRKLAYKSSEIDGLLDSITMKQMEQMMYRSVLFYSSAYKRDNHALFQLASPQLLEAFDAWGKSQKVNDSIDSIMNLNLYTDQKFPNAIEAPVQIENGYKVSLMEGDIIVYFEIGKDEVPYVTDMEIK